MISRFLSHVTILILVLIRAGGCGQSDTVPPESDTPENIQAGPTLAPGEVIHISGEGDYVSDPFKLDGDGAVQVYWRQESTEFIVELVNANEQLAEGPKGRITFALESGPSEFVEENPFIPPFEYIPGEYVLEISADGTWEVWATVTYP